MKLFQTIKLAWSNIWGNKMRSFLTMLGMVIGVASVIVLVSLINGAIGDIMESFESMGINEISVNITGKTSRNVTEEDFYQYAREHTKELDGVTPLVTTYGTLKNGSVSLDSSTIWGVDEYYMKIKDYKLQKGSPISYSDLTIRRKCCVIGSFVNQRLFQGNAQVGDSILLDGNLLTIVGVMEAKSENTEWSVDNCVIMPYTTVQKLGGGSSISYTFYAKNNAQITEDTEKIKEFLYSKYYNKKAYSVRNNADVLKEVKTQRIMLTSLAGGIAGISLLVAGIGIMNIMLVSVTERTREIGIRKSLGAKQRNIMSQFVIEAGITSTIGGLMGIGLGCLATGKIGQIASVKHAVPDQQIIVIAFCISVGVGIIFGYLPAKKAARLNPIDALRSE